MLRPHLITFLKVCETGSFTSAAAASFISPSAVLQQMRTLEEELGVTLFERSTKGVSLTPAGEYLKQRGSILYQENAVLHREIHNAAVHSQTICIGTSIMEKCRLLYELWVLFSEENKDCEIQMLNIDAWHKIPERTDLIESVSSNVDWQQEWEFFEICKVPFGFAVAGGHPLSGKKVLTLDDLKGTSVITLNEGSSPEVSAVIGYLKKAGITITCRREPEVNTLWELGFSRSALLVPMCWKDIMINSATIPFEKDFFIPYGIFYRQEPGAAVKKFLDFIKDTYQNGNASGVVPVLE